jgi:SAM-dependent methyltransferase
MRNTLRCPRCAHPLPVPTLADGDAARGELSCAGCAATFPVHRGVADLRGETPPTCFTSARTVPEADLVAQLAERPPAASLPELVEIYAGAHRLPPELGAQDRRYFLEAYDREAWTVAYMEFCTRRYAGGELRGARALDAGCGSGGSLPHLANRFESVTGVDPDLPALLIAAKRCRELGVADHVTLAAGMLEQPVLAPDAFDAIKCTDVIEHVADPDRAAASMARALAPEGFMWVLTPNRWAFFAPEPHVGLWGVQFLPRLVADAYVQHRVGMRYSDIAHLLSYRRLVRALRAAGLAVRPVPVEDKHLNPESARGRALKAAFDRPPLRWLSTAVRPLQPTLEVACVGDGATRAGRRRASASSSTGQDASDPGARAAHG